VVNPIVYQVCDTGTPLPIQCDTAKIYVTVTPINDAPVANSDTATTNANTAITFNIINNDTDVDGKINPATIDLDPLTAGIQTSFTVANQGIFMADPTTGVVIFTPVKDYFGTVTPIIYQVCDTGTPLPIQCDTAKIYIKVLPVH
jgi:CshA-type fibril repeat protein